MQWVAAQYVEYLLLLGRELGLEGLHGVPLRSSLLREMVRIQQTDADPGDRPSPPYANPDHAPLPLREPRLRSTDLRRCAVLVGFGDIVGRPLDASFVASARDADEAGRFS